MGFLEDLTKIHCVWSYEINTPAWDESESSNPNSEAYLRDHLEQLQEADYLVGHNIIGYDIPAIQKVYPWFKPKGILIDTLIWSRLAYPDRFELDWKTKATYKEILQEQKCLGHHSLKSWGIRLSDYKGSIADEEGETDWSVWTPEMHEYCKQDVQVNTKVYQKLLANKHLVTNQALWCEHEVKKVIIRQEQKGFLFDVPKAQKLYMNLTSEKEKLTEELKKTFGEIVKKTPFTPKVNRPDLGYQKGVPTFKVKTEDFNPGSRDHAVYWFKKKYQWKPHDFTPAGKPKMDESVLKAMPYCEAKLLAKYYEIQKVLGMLSDGDKGWLRLVDSEGRIHGKVNTQGAGTGRMTHSNPNLAQIPARGNLWSRL